MNNLSIEELKTMPKPSHIAVIMDGNGRWAVNRGQPRTYGHMKGVSVVEKITEFCAKIGVGALTLYSFSTENWKRPAEEVNFLMSIFNEYMKTKLSKFLENDIRFKVMGRVKELPENVQETISRTEQATAGCGGMLLNLAVNYSGRAEIIDAVKRIVSEHAVKEGSPEAENYNYIDEKYIRNYLYSPSLGDPELLIRTSNEFRISNFLLWQIAYSEIYITEKLWPDFEEADLVQAIINYNSRERRFGGIKPAITVS
ncbi:MAG: Isoprenyl transferase [bacterium ADurb.Bin243]|nr:MAG: Isoprenyl transferase [bacterium ADurb.Bin243]